MKKVVIIIAVVLGLLAVLAYTFRNELQFAVMMTMLKPDVAFADDNRHTPPDYANSEHWAALPEREDGADVTPVGIDADNQAIAPVGVFFIHPTTYYTADHWNQPLDHAEANTFTDEQVLRNQASVFNGCCKVYAPRYRQATLYAFMDEGEDGPAAIDFAYADVEAAFKYFLDHYSDGQPFVLAGHSQGAEHANRLMKNLIAGTDLEERLIAAYPIGFNFDGSNGIPVCESATQTGCQVTWNSVAPDAPSFRDTSGDLCVNPLNWKADGSYADFTENLGAVSFNAAAEIEVAAMDAQCKDGRLHVTEVRSNHFDGRMFGPGNYHVFDIGFFYINLRNNAMERVQAYLQR